jgi:hypothetical protein
MNAMSLHMIQDLTCKGKPMNYSQLKEATAQHVDPTTLLLPSLGEQTQSLMAENEWF